MSFFHSDSSTHAAIHCSLVFNALARMKDRMDVYLEFELKEDIDELMQPKPARFFGLIKAKPGLSKEEAIETLKRDSDQWAPYRMALIFAGARMRNLQSLANLATMTSGTSIMCSQDDAMLISNTLKMTMTPEEIKEQKEKA